MSGAVTLPGLFFFAVELYILVTAYSRLSGPGGAGEASGAPVSAGFGSRGAAVYAVRLPPGLPGSTGPGGPGLPHPVGPGPEARTRYEKTKSFRHDLRNHLFVLEGLLGAGQTEAARRYLRKLEAASSELSPPCRTGGPALDVLLGEKLELARSRGVDAEAFLRLPEERAVDSFDLCVIFADALDNALRACEALEGEAFISVKGQRQGDFYRLEFENSCAAEPQPGTGLSNIGAVAEKYGGVVDFQRDGNCFRLAVLLNIS